MNLLKSILIGILRYFSFLISNLSRIKTRTDYLIKLACIKFSSFVLAVPFLYHLYYLHLIVPICTVPFCIGYHLYRIQEQWKRTDKIIIRCFTQIKMKKKKKDKNIFKDNILLNK
jgi:hypothetical protein